MVSKKKGVLRAKTRVPRDITIDESFVELMELKEQMALLTSQVGSLMDAINTMEKKNKKVKEQKTES